MQHSFKVCGGLSRDIRVYVIGRVRVSVRQVVGVYCQDKKIGKYIGKNRDERCLLGSILCWEQDVDRLHSALRRFALKMSSCNACTIELIVVVHTYFKLTRRLQDVSCLCNLNTHVLMWIKKADDNLLPYALYILHTDII